MGVVPAQSGGGGGGSGSSITYYRKTTTKQVVNTVAATDLLNAEITVAAGVMGTNGRLELEAWGDWLQNTAGAQARNKFQLLLGGVTLIDTNSGPNAGISATRGRWHLRATILNLTAASQQVWFGLDMKAPNTWAAGSAVFTTGSGMFAAIIGGASDQAGQGNGYNTTAVDTTVACPLVLNTVNGVADPAYDVRLLGAFVAIQ